VVISFFYNSVSEIGKHRYYDLFLRRSLSGGLNLFTLVIWFGEYSIVDLDDLLVWKCGKSFLYSEDIY